MKGLCKSDFVCKIGLGANANYYSINTIAESIGDNMCKALPFFHAFSGCDTVSSFFKHEKGTMWDAWINYSKHDTLTRVFQELSEQPSNVSSSQVDIIEGYVKYLFYGKAETDSLDIERMNHLNYLAETNLRFKEWTNRTY